MSLLDRYQEAIKKPRLIQPTRPVQIYNDSNTLMAEGQSLSLYIDDGRLYITVFDVITYYILEEESPLTIYYHEIDNGTLKLMWKIHHSYNTSVSYMSDDSDHNIYEFISTFDCIDKND